MRRRIALVALLVIAVAAPWVAYRYIGWDEYQPGETRLLVDLAHPDALIRTTSLSKLPRDLLRVPIAKDVLTEELAFYYEQHEDRLSVNGAVKRIAYERNLAWTDRILAHVLDEPAEIALWRDGKGALRYFAIAMRRSALAKLLQEAATVALKDTQLTLAGEIKVGRSGVQVYALELHPRRTLLIASSGDRIVVLSDAGLMLDEENRISPPAQQAVAAWLSDSDALARDFELDAIKRKSFWRSDRPEHTLALSARALTLGYAPFVPGLKGLRFDFGGEAWATHAWIDPKGLPQAGLNDPELWRAAPANPAACGLLPLDWQRAAKVVTEAEKKPALPDAQALASLEGAALACWYPASSLYTPVFIARLAKDLPDRDAALQALSNWAIKPPKTGGDEKNKLPEPKLSTSGAYVVFSPDPALVELALDTLARKNPSAADQMAGTGATLALLTPRALSEMAEKEIFAALEEGDSALKTTAKSLLPPRLQALSKYPPYRLVLPPEEKAQGGWQTVEWRSPKDAK